MTFNQHRIAVFTLLVALLLAACGQAPPQSWSGVAYSSSTETIYVARATHLYAISTAGTLRWQFPSDNANLGPFQADPAVADDTIVVTSWNKSAYALNSNGQQKWIFAESQDRLIAPATVHGDRVYVPSADNTLYVLDLGGARQWTFQAKAGLWGGVAVTEDLIYVPSMDHNLYALDGATGNQRWVADLNGALAGTPALDEDTVYVGTLSDMLYALDASTGAERWTVKAKGWVWGTPLVAGETLYFGDMEGYVFSVNSADGSINWSVKPGGAVRGTPALSGDTLIVATENGFVFALDAQSGETRWQKEIDDRNADRLLANPIIAGDTAIIVPLYADQLVYGLNTANGDVRWTFKP